MSSKKRGILIVNLGSPDSTETKDVKRYLKEFLMDERVIDVPFLLRKFLIEGIVLNTRPKKSAAAYKKIWWEEGSPLIVISQRVLEKLKEKINEPIALGMRYGNPSIKAAIEALYKQEPQLEEVFLIPLYPHYAMSSFETVVVKAREVVAQHFPQLKMEVQPAFYEEEAYIDSLAASIRSQLPEAFDQLLFSYHGVPERHIKKGDSSKSHCLQVEDCCSVHHPCQSMCYRHQVFRTSELVAEKLGLSRDRYSVSFQSRLGPDPWLQPFTDHMLEEFPSKGVKKLAIVCPAFVSDCLETLEEIGMEGKEEFLEAGGEEFHMISCLNEDDSWVNVLAGYIQQSKKQLANV
ncbi:MAG: ferrochelatase [Bacteroidota bacterium]